MSFIARRGIPSSTYCLLGLDLAILLDVDVVVGLEDAHLVFWELYPGTCQRRRVIETNNLREAFDEGKLMLDLTTIRLSLVLSLGELLGGGVLLERDLLLSAYFD